MTYSEEYKGFTIEIDQEQYYDEFYDPRRNGDTLGQMVCFHRRYSLPNETSYKESAFDSWDEVEARICKDFDIAVILPIFAYDHSGFWMSTKVEQGWYHYRWDGGRVGFIFATKQDVRKWFDVKRITKAIDEQVTEILRQEVVYYSAYTSGEVYQCSIKDENDEFVDGMGGFFDVETAIASAKEQIDLTLDKVTA